MTTPTVAGAQQPIDRTVLPIQPPHREAITELDARNAAKPARFEVKAPEGAPNVVIVLIDDIGFGATAAVWRRHRDARRWSSLANYGLRFNRFPHNGALFADAERRYCPAAIITT